LTELSIVQAGVPPASGTWDNTNCISAGLEIDAPPPSKDDYGVAINTMSTPYYGGSYTGTVTVSPGSIPATYTVHGTIDATMAADPGGTGSGTATAHVTF
jgi:hypothetical protein